MGVFFRRVVTPASAEALKPVMRDALQQAPRDAMAREGTATQLAKSAAAAAAGTAEQVPRPLAFIGAGVLLVILLVAWIYVASLVDAQSPPVENSQLKLVADGLGAAFTTVMGLIVGLITGESATQ